MKKIRAFSLLLFTGILLTACTIKKPPQNLQMKGSGEFDRRTISFTIDTSLPKNAKLNFSIKDEDSKKTIFNTTLLTDKNGSVSKKIPIDVGNKKLVSLLLFDPEDQTKNIQDKFGEYGQNIRPNLNGYIKKKKNGKEIFYIRLYGNFLKFGKLSSGGYIVFASKRMKSE
jgi:hypothetical protein